MPALAYIGKTTKLDTSSAFNHTTTAETNGLIAVCSNRMQNVDAAVAYNNVAMTVVDVGSGKDGYWRTSIHYMQSPPVGTYHVDVTNGDVNMACTMINVSGLLETGSPVHHSDDHGGSADPMTAHFSSVADEMVIDVIVVGESSWHPNSGQTLIDSNWFGSNALHGCSYYLGALTDPSWHRGTANDGSYVAAAFKNIPGTNYTSTVSGALTFVGTEQGKALKVLAGAQTNTGTVTKFMTLQRTVLAGAQTNTGIVAAVKGLGLLLIARLRDYFLRAEQVDHALTAETRDYFLRAEQVDHALTAETRDYILTAPKRD